MIHEQQAAMVEEMVRRLAKKYMRGSGEDPVRMVMDVCRETGGGHIWRTTTEL